MSNVRDLFLDCPGDLDVYVRSYKKAAIAMIVASDPDGVIGRDGGLPWKNLKGDLPRFKALTKDSALVMGRKTYESLPGMLPGRPHVVITSNPDSIKPKKHKGAHAYPTVVGSMSEAMGKALMMSRSVAIIGGAGVFEQGRKYAKTLHLTRTTYPYAGDTYSPIFKSSPPSDYLFNDLRLVSTHEVYHDGRHSHTYVDFVRRNSDIDTVFGRVGIKTRMVHINKNTQDN